MYTSHPLYHYNYVMPPHSPESDDRLQSACSFTAAENRQDGSRPPYGGAGFLLGIVIVRRLAQTSRLLSGPTYSNFGHPAARVASHSAAGLAGANGLTAMPCRFKQKPGPALGLVNPNLDQAGGGDVAMFIANVMGLSQSRN